MKADENARPVQRDRGAALLLTIAFVVMIGAIAGGLAGLVTSGLNNTVTLQGLRDRQYAADGAIENAITVVRAEMEVSDACVADASGSTHSELNQVSIRVDWRGACGVAQGAAGFIVLQRDVVFTACLDVGDSCTHDTSIVSAQVNFGQGDSGPVRSTVIQRWSVDQ